MYDAFLYISLKGRQKEMHLPNLWCHP